MTPLDIALMGRVAPRGAATDTDAAAWATAVTSAGGTYSSPTLAALSNFITAAKANGYWTKLYCFNPLCGDQLAAARVQYVNGSWAQATVVNFVSGDYTEATGMTGNGSTKYLNTGVSVNALTVNSTHMALYNRSSTAASGGYWGADDATRSFRAAMPDTSATVIADEYDGSDGRVSASATAPYGFIVASRTASNAHAVYRNGSSIASNTKSGGTMPSGVNMYVFARNANGTAANFSAQPFAAYSFGSGLSSTEVGNYNTDMQAFQTAMGRNV